MRKRKEREREEERVHTEKEKESEERKHDNHDRDKSPLDVIKNIVFVLKKFKKYFLLGKGYFFYFSKASKKVP